MVFQCYVDQHTIFQSGFIHFQLTKYCNCSLKRFLFTVFINMYADLTRCVFFCLRDRQLNGFLLSVCKLMFWHSNLVLKKRPFRIAFCYNSYSKLTVGAVSDPSAALKTSFFGKVSLFNNILLKNPLMCELYFFTVSL